MRVLVSIDIEPKPGWSHGHDPLFGGPILHRDWGDKQSFNAERVEEVLTTVLGSTEYGDEAWWVTCVRVVVPPFQQAAL